MLDFQKNLNAQPCTHSEADTHAKPSPHLQPQTEPQPARPAHSSPEQNHLLATLPARVRNRLLPHLDLVHLPRGKVLQTPGTTLHYVYFPIDTIVAKLNLMRDGALTEVTVVGNDGMVGIDLIIGNGTAVRHAAVQVAGYAYRLAGQRLTQEFNQHSELLNLLLRYTQALMTQIAQNAVCNRHHSIQQQLCRWLLLSLDRLPGNQLQMTQETISNLLGVRREGITDAAGKLQKLGLISYQRGRIAVLDRPGLERVSCECYAEVRRETERLLPHTHNNSAHPVVLKL